MDHQTIGVSELEALWHLPPKCFCSSGVRMYLWYQCSEENCQLGTGHVQRPRSIPLFKEMVMSRAKVAHLAGFKSYFDYRSQKKMMDTRSVELFLKNLKSQIALQPMLSWRETENASP
jgi:Zn-dependent oligopeptidase